MTIAGAGALTRRPWRGRGAAAIHAAPEIPSSSRSWIAPSPGTVCGLLSVAENPTPANSGARWCVLSSTADVSVGVGVVRGEPIFPSAPIHSHVAWGRNGCAEGRRPGRQELAAVSRSRRVPTGPKSGSVTDTRQTCDSFTTICPHSPDFTRLGAGCSLTNPCL
jgi:hypothetical protein